MGLGKRVVGATRKFSDRNGSSPRMVFVAQWLERLPVKENVGGPNPLDHPNYGRV